ncbi:zinc finger protein 62 homolog [Aedes albopictus]|uniref:C2h2-type zn-finger protein n=1 Tax=Aedes albopictus TaxID=7160 RepID=A0ABM1XK03_AEDAL
MTGFNLKHFPDVCRLCFKAAESAGKMYSIEGNFEKLSLDIQSFLDKFTFPVKESKAQHIPRMVCDVCLKQLTDFAMYRNRCILSLRFMEALVDVKDCNSEPLTSLLRDSKEELNALFKDVSLCKTEPEVEDILQALQESKLMEFDTVVKVEKVELPEPPEDNDYVHEDAISECPDDPQSEEEIKPELYLATEFSSDDDAPLARRKKVKPKSPAKAKEKSNSGERAKRKGRPRIHPLGKALEEPWSCDKCKFTTKLRHSVGRHLLVHKNRENRNYPCDICGMGFKSKGERKIHTITHPEKQFMCEVCGTALKTADSFKIHMDRHKGTEKLTCEYCDYTTLYPQYLKAHMKTHTTEVYANRCELCNASFRYASLLKRHLETHGNERKYACEQCSARFNTKNALRNHRNCVHLVVRYPCEYCEKRFDQKLTLRDHVEKVHNIQCNFPCDICLLTYDSQEKLDSHRQRHENPKPLECGICLTIHANQEAFDGHLCISYRDDYVCCERDLRNFAKYNRHMWSKHGMKTNFRVKPIPGVLMGQLRKTRKRLIQCRKCDIAFPTKALKMQHMMECNQSSAIQS